MVRRQQAAALAVGASQPVGQRWFHNAGGMPPFDLTPLTGRYLSFREREEIALLRVQGAGVRQIARAIGRDPSTVSREMRRNAATRGSKSEYRASVAQWKAELSAKRPKPAKLVTNERLDNAQHERFWSTLKTEFYQRHRFVTQAGAIHAVSSSIDTVYNHRRRHSSLGQIPPVAFEHRIATAANQAA